MLSFHCLAQLNSCLYGLSEMNKAKWIGILLTAALILVAGFYGLVRFANTHAPSGWSQSQPAKRADPDDEARRLLGLFLAAKTVEAKMEYVIPLNGLKERMQLAYQNPKFLQREEELDVELFTNRKLILDYNSQDLDDVRLDYELPEVADAESYFSSIIDSDAAMGLKTIQPNDELAIAIKKKPSSLVRTSVVFSRSSDPMKFDWDIYHQSLSKSLQNYLANPSTQTELVRVLIRPVPSSVTGHVLPKLSNDSSWWYISDLAYPDEGKYVTAPKLIADYLFQKKWVTNRMGNTQPQVATLQLIYDGQRAKDGEPMIRIKEFISWGIVGKSN